MRNKAASSMQKTYDECYLICSTAVYFEGQVDGLHHDPGARSFLWELMSLCRTMKLRR